jgi:DNA-binding MurR/RpiR family transcriptional regulator
MLAGMGGKKSVGRFCGYSRSTENRFSHKDGYKGFVEIKIVIRYLYF